MKKFIMSLRVMLTAVLLLTAGVPVLSAPVWAIDDEEFLNLSRYGTAEAIEEAIRAGADVNAVNQHQETALHLAAYQNNDPQVIRVLIENGANVDARDMEDGTPLMAAATWGKAGNIQALLDGGANVELFNNRWRSAVDVLPDSTPVGVDEAEWMAVTERLKNEFDPSQVGPGAAVGFEGYTFWNTKRRMGWQRNGVEFLSSDMRYALDAGYDETEIGWLAVSPLVMDEMGGSKSGIIFYVFQEDKYYFLPYERAHQVQEVQFGHIMEKDNNSISVLQNNYINVIWWDENYNYFEKGFTFPDFKDHGSNDAPSDYSRSFG